jgi:hypothetical protein
MAHALAFTQGKQVRMRSTRIPALVAFCLVGLGLFFGPALGADKQSKLSENDRMIRSCAANA